MDTVDILAQRRLDFALMLRERGDFEAALSLFEECLERAPIWADAHFAFAETLQIAERMGEATEHYIEYLRLAPEDAMGAEVQLALIGTAPVPKTLPPAYVRTLFDGYADRFEQSLLGGLAYCAPTLLRAAIEAVRPAPIGSERILDLGCGTGLVGEAFSDRACWLEGCDLSAGMIAKAERKEIYHGLHVGEALAALTHPLHDYNLIVAGDVLVYMGELGPLFSAVHGALNDSGLFAFSVEKSSVAPFMLGTECRYAHHPVYLRDLAEENGFLLLSLQDVVCRQEAGRDVPGMIAVLGKPSDVAAQVDYKNEARPETQAYIGAVTD